MIVETSKGAVSLAGATAVTVKRNPASYVPKLIGLLASILGLMIVAIMLREFLREPGQARWWEWLVLAAFVLGILSTLIGGGLSMLGDPEKSKGTDENYALVAMPMFAFAAFSLFMAVLTPGGNGILFSVTFLVLGGVALWSRHLAGKVDATITYAPHRTTVKALNPGEAERLSAALRQTSTPA